MACADPDGLRRVSRGSDETSHRARPELAGVARSRGHPGPPRLRPLNPSCVVSSCNQPLAGIENAYDVSNGGPVGQPMEPRPYRVEYAAIGQHDDEVALS